MLQFILNSGTKDAMDYRTLGQQSHFDQYGRKNRLRTPNKLIYVVAAILALGVLLTVLNIYELHKMKEDHTYHANLPVVEGKTGSHVETKPIVWVAGKRLETGYLKHVYNVFERIGYVTGDPVNNWEVLWSHDYPFISFSTHLSALKSYQKVNHFPGSGYITNKASLASTSSKLSFIPTAFKMPKEKDKYLDYIKTHKDTMWVQKNNNHRGIEIKTVKELDFTQEGSFIQEYISKPYLIDRKKFDIGIYAILTSIKPLRVYVVDGDVLVRFCPKNYHPFNSKDRDQYVVGDDYTPMWQMPSLKKMFSEMDFNFKDTLHYHIEKSGKNASKLWSDIKEAILTVYKDKESSLIQAAYKYKTTRNFFEMVRFDFVLDEDLNVYLMEANMSPNLSSSHFRENKRLYEHVVFNLLSLVGLARSVTNPYHKSSDDMIEMQVSDKDIAVFPDICVQSCSQSCTKVECKVCHKCLSGDFKLSLKTAYLEHINRGTCRRLFPPPMTQEAAKKWSLSKADAKFKSLKLDNQIMQLWFIGKCRQDATFCV